MTNERGSAADWIPVRARDLSGVAIVLAASQPRNAYRAPEREVAGR
jgi:hypothetical protein